MWHGVGFVSLVFWVGVEFRLLYVCWTIVVGLHTGLSLQKVVRLL